MESAKASSTVTPWGVAPVKLSVFHYVDGTDPVIEPFLSEHRERWEKSLPDLDSTHVILEMARRRTSIPRKLVSAAILAGVPVLGAVSALLAPGIATVLGGGLSGATFPSALHASRAFLESAHKQWQDRDLPAWKGVKRFLFSGQEGCSRELASGPLKTAPRRRFDEFLGLMRDFPSEKQVVVMSGHGLGYHRLAGMKVREVGQAFEEAHRQQGRKPDVLVLESCLLSNLESLWHLRHAARYAVVSEEVLSDLLPIQEVIKSSKGSSSRELALSLLEKSKGNAKIHTLAVVDLEALPDLVERLNDLGKTIREAGEEGPAVKQAVARSVRGSRKFPEGLSFYLERNLFKFRDLGDFLGRLKQTGHPEISAKAEATRQAFQKAVFASVAPDGKYQGASGMSAHLAGKLGRFAARIFLNRKSDAYPAIAPEWNRFVDSL